MEVLQRAIDLWVTMTGVDPKSNSIRNFPVYFANKDLEESMKLDPSGVLTSLLLSGYVNRYMEERIVSLYSVINPNPKDNELFTTSKELFTLVTTGVIKEHCDNHVKQMQETIEHYGITLSEEKKEEIADYSMLAHMHKKALKSMETLQVHQFSHGGVSDNVPAYYKTIFRFWDMGSFVQALASLENDTIIIAYIHNQKERILSYFAIGIRNGGSVTVLTDKHKFVDPDQFNRLRSFGRDFEERVKENGFPYEQLGAKLDGKYSYFSELETSSITVGGMEHAGVMAIEDLTAENLVWTLIMFSLINQKFFKEGYQTDQLSYTGSMIKNTKLLLGSETTQIVQAGVKEIDLGWITSSDVESSKVEDNFVAKPTGQYDWLEARYGHLIDDKDLNLIESDTEDGKKLLAIGESDSAEDRRAGYLKGFEKDHVGTFEEMQKDHIWFARYNKAKLVFSLAKKEIEERKDELYHWVMTKARENIDFLMECIAEGKLVVHSLNMDENPNADPLWISGWRGKTLRRNGNILSKEESTYLRPYGKYVINGGLDADKNSLCYINGKKANVSYSFHPANADSLAILLGLSSVSELPDLLQFWKETEKEIGNHLLGRYDPMDWVFRNLWHEYSFNVYIHISKSGLRTLRK